MSTISLKKFRILEYKPSNNPGENTNVWQYCTKDECDFDCAHKEFDLANFFGKIWITHELTLFRLGKDEVKELISKLHKCDAKDLYFSSLEIYVSDLKLLLSKSVKECSMRHVSVIDENDENIPIEDIVEMFSGVKELNL